MQVLPMRGNVNDAAAALAAKAPDKIIGFMSVHPDAPDAIGEIERSAHDLGLRGMKLGPNYQGFDPVGANAFRVYGKAQEMGLPIVFHQGTSPFPDAPLRYAHPLVMDEIAAAFPDLRIVMAHMAHPWHVDCVNVIRKHQNVYADVSGALIRPWQAYHAFMQACEWGMLPKLLFASDFPGHHARGDHPLPARTRRLRAHVSLAGAASRRAGVHHRAGLVVAARAALKRRARCSLPIP